MLRRTPWSVSAVFVLATNATGCDDGSAASEPAVSAHKPENQGQGSAAAADESQPTPAPAPTPAAQPSPALDVEPPKMSDYASMLVEVGQSGEFGALARITDRDRGITYQHTADGKAGAEINWPTGDQVAFAAHFKGEEFTPSHYIGAMLDEIGPDPELAKEIVVDEDKNTLAYDGISGHWGVVFSFARTRGGGVFLHSIATWDEAP